MQQSMAQPDLPIYPAVQKVVQKVIQKAIHPHGVILVIGGADTRDIYGDHFYQVGMHQYASFGIGRNWYNKQFWIDLDNELSEKGLSFRAIMFDKGSEQWLSQIPFKDTLIYIVDIFNKYLTDDGIILFPERYGIIPAINEYNDERYGYDSGFYNPKYGNDPIFIIKNILEVKYNYVLNYCFIDSNSLYIYSKKKKHILTSYEGIYSSYQKKQKGIMPITVNYNGKYTQIEFIKEYILKEDLNAAEVEKRHHDPYGGGNIPYTNRATDMDAAEVENRQHEPGKKLDITWAKHMDATSYHLSLEKEILDYRTELEQEIIKYVINAEFNMEQYNETVKQITDLYSSIEHITHNNDKLLLTLNIGSKKYYIKFTPHSFISRTENKKLYKPFVIYSDGITYKMVKYGCYDDKLEDIIQEQQDMTPEERQIFAVIHERMDLTPLMEHVKERTRITQIEANMIIVKRIEKEIGQINPKIYTDIVFNYDTYILSFTEISTGAKYEIRYTVGYPYTEPLFFYNNKKVAIDNDFWRSGTNILDIIEYINKKVKLKASHAAAHTAEQAAAHMKAQGGGGIRRKKYKFAY